MHYQKLLSEEAPYVAQLFDLCVFELHVHCELEMIYCLEGQFSISVAGEQYAVEKNQLVVLPSMKPHEAACDDPNIRVLLIKVGPTLLRRHFASLSDLSCQSPVLTVEDDGFRNILQGVAENCSFDDPTSKMKVTSGLYALCAYLLEHYGRAGRQEPQKEKKHISMAEMTQYMVMNHVSSITVEEAARLSGYSVGNFCRLFKLSTGKSFHAYLNAYRIKKAELLLSETALSVKSVAATVGFSETKSFCRVFKSIHGMTPTEYRKKQYC